MGAGIGPGSSSQTFSLNWLGDKGRFGGSFERIVRDNDFFRAIYTPQRTYLAQWVDLSVNLNKSWEKNRLLYDARLSYVRSLNYQWQNKLDQSNVHARMSVSYLF